MSVPAWLEDFALAVGEDELRAALETAIEAGDLGEHEGQRKTLRRIVRGPIAHNATPKAARSRQSR